MNPTSQYPIAYYSYVSPLLCLYLSSARAICNLSYIQGHESMIEKQGAVKTLMVIGLGKHTPPLVLDFYSNNSFTLTL